MHSFVTGQQIVFWAVCEVLFQREFSVQSTTYLIKLFAEQLEVSVLPTGCDKRSGQLQHYTTKQTRNNSQNKVLRNISTIWYCITVPRKLDVMYPNKHADEGMSPGNRFQIFQWQKCQGFCQETSNQFSCCGIWWALRLGWILNLIIIHKLQFSNSPYNRVCVQWANYETISN